MCRLTDQMLMISSRQGTMGKPMLLEVREDHCLIPVRMLNVAMILTFHLLCPPSTGASPAPGVRRTTPPTRPRGPRLHRRIFLRFRTRTMVGPSSGSNSLKEYLKRYENNEEEKKKKKQKQKKKTRPDMNGVLVVDEDPVWQKPVQLEEEDDESQDEEKPQVDEDIEVKRMKRLEQVKTRRPFGAISEDGSGWVSVSDNAKNLTSDELNYGLSPLHKRSAHDDAPEHELNSSVKTLNSDISPPRKRRARNDTPFPEPINVQSDRRNADDISPPRRRGKPVLPEGMGRSLLNTSQDAKHGHDIDISPPRKRRPRCDTPSPEPNLKPSRLGREDSPTTQPRRKTKHRHTPSPEPEMKLTKSFNSDPDLSPPRKGRPQELVNSDLSPPRRGHHKSSNQNRPRTSVVEDLSPPRKKREARHQTLDDRHRQSVSVSDLSPPRKPVKESGSLTELPKTGLVSGKDIKEEIAKTKKEDWLRFRNMDPSISGRDAEGVRRDKRTGERLSKDQIKLLQKQEEKPKEIKLEWGKGLAQKREAEAKLQELELEKDKPFARTRDDPDLDNMLKDRVRWGDPMAHLVKKKSYEVSLPDMGEDERMKESGFVIPQEVPNHSWLKRGLEAAPNRYGIRPGRHWDGVDRSNGFEKQMFNRQNEKQATEREAYLWSVADM
ncbi:hypothetical protein L6452_19897 [Arctium lappa]|uniref:Uncharacterized protein n=1 Tax=Arctium lappa TaxID=4217 RepID=A0ACB9BAN3_ARCLA|nr:hypothetical protein L6452_19897 [Arctium lappa]